MRLTTRGRPRWMYAAAAAVVLAAGVVAYAWLSGPELIALGPPPGRVTIAGRLTLEPASPVAGGTVTARASISADRVVTLSRLTVRVRDEAGALRDFPEQQDVRLGTAPRDIVLQRRFDATGTYTYWLTYELDGDWVDLPPWQQVTVR
ncbi:hypothetical protein ABT369_09280 [Dactylosporangium sp. NPDC000244]|uniref:hypothetical protein n=1 Tax=Dactylosporangium sp. NPDC000244 TaxID=3154365 RepID=UPI0033213C39